MKLVAQSCTLLYRRFAICGRLESTQPSMRRSVCRFQIGDTPNSALRGSIWVMGSAFRAMSRVCVVVLFFGLAAELFAQETATEEGRTRFCAVDIYVDSKASLLAAYQLEFSVTNGVAKIVGIEGGEHPAFHEPPFYDPKAMQHERVILAAFSTGNELPSGKTRVATIHLQVVSDAALQCELRLQAAGNAAAARIAAEASFKERRPQ